MRFGVLLFCVLFLFSCSWNDAQMTTKKTDFFVKLLPTATEESKTEFVEKSSRITAGSTLMLASDWVGQVSVLNVKEGDFVKKWQTLITLKDTIWMYDIRLRQAENALRGQNVAVSNTEVSVDRALTDAQIAFDQAERAYNTLLADVTERKKKAESDYFNSDLSKTGSIASSNYEKAKLDLEKADIDYKNILANNTQQLSNIDSSYHVFANDVRKTLEQMVFEADKVLGVTNAYQTSNDTFESFLGARNSATRTQAETLFYSAQKDLDTVKSKTSVLIKEDNASSEMNELIAVFSRTRSFIDAMSKMYENTVPGGSSLTQAQIDGWITQWNWYKSAMQLSESQFVTFKNQTVTFLNTYKNTEASSLAGINSLKQQLEIAKKNIENGNSDGLIAYNRTLISIDDQLKDASLRLEQARNALDVAKKNKSIALEQADVSKINAIIWLEQASRDYNKLFITSPVNGTITRVLASVWQNVNAWSQMVEVVSDDPQIILDVEWYIAVSLEKWMEIIVISGDSIFTGIVTGISDAANANLLYTVRISVPDAVDVIGESATVRFAIEQTWALIMPLSSLRIISEQEGEISVLTGSGEIQNVLVKIDSVINEQVKINANIPPHSKIILTDLSNFDSMKHQIKIDMGSPLTASGSKE